MRLFEHQAKELFRTYGMPVPRGVLASDVQGVRAAFRSLSPPLVVKAQVLAGGRGKAGGVVVVSNEAEAAREAERIFSLSIGGERPSAVLVEEAFDHTEEMYLSVALDRGERSFVSIASRSGGVDVESLSGRVVVPLPLDGLDRRTADGIASRLGLESNLAGQFSDILLRLERLSREKECELAEINPLALGTDGRLMPLDAKVILDDNALFRHPEFSKLHPEDRYEGEASRQGFAFVHLDGDIAVVGNGAGLVLSTLDLVADAGGKPACFLDLGGGAQRERVEAALRLVNSLPNSRRILVNIFGGITRTVDVAQGLMAVVSEGGVKPVFARISGAEEEDARELLKGSQVRLYGTAQEAVEAVVKGA